VQAWRTTEFPAEAHDSRVEVLLEAIDAGTRVTIVHSNIPEGQGEKYREGWRQFYLEPLKLFLAPSVKKAAPRPATATKAKKAAKPTKARKTAAKRPAKKKAAKKAPKKTAAKKAAPKKKTPPRKKAKPKK
jgi:hypothetical protein